MVAAAGGPPSGGDTPDCEAGAAAGAGGIAGEDFDLRKSIMVELRLR